MSKTELSSSPEDFINAILAVALQVESQAESQQLVTYIKDVVPYVERGEEWFEQILAIDNLAHYWDATMSTEDNISPALSIAFAILAFTLDTYLLEVATERAKINSRVISENSGITDDITYEDFCDKYAHLLN